MWPSIFPATLSSKNFPDQAPIAGQPTDERLSKQPNAAKLVILDMNLKEAYLRVLLLACLGMNLHAHAASLNFSRDVLPILSDKCFACHGPDTRKATDLRLDSREAAMAERDGQRALDTANPEKSGILLRIQDLNDPMPPLDAEKQLTPEEKQVLIQWIREGGKYGEHWAFTPPSRAPGQTLDSWVVEKLQQEGVGFAPEAPPSILARRAALVLTGLPPEPEQLQRFLSNPGPAGYLQLVDELLASPRFGEHQARYWLDAVRYGDTHGLHLDNRRGIYPYRDWVIRALNQNLSFKDFIVWQLAGDLLPNPSLDQLIATGFVRMNPSTSEGGAIPEEFQVKNNFDRVETLGTVLLGMSFNCARCHTHKYDPITQTEYYQLMAFFNSTAEGPMDGNAYRYGPVVQTPRDLTDWQRWESLKNQRRDLLASIEEPLVKLLEANRPAEDSWKVEEWKISDAYNTDKAAPAEDQWKSSNKAPSGQLPKATQARSIACKIQVQKPQTLWLQFSSSEGFEVHLDGELVSSRGKTQAFPLAEGPHEIRLRIIGSNDRLPLECSISSPWSTWTKDLPWTSLDEESQLRILGDTRTLSDREHLDRVQAAHSLASEIASLESEFTTTLIARDLPTPRETRLLIRGEYDMPSGNPLSPGVPAALGRLPESFPSNRLGLARWMVSDENPLVARVLVNRIWQRVMGHAIVRSPEDFGRQGSQPTHPELLDWLAIEFRESGWDLKHLLRLLVTSRTFLQDSAWRSDLSDPENRLFGRGPSHRLDAEVLRDMALWAAGTLEPSMGGEGVKPDQPPGLWRALTHPASNTVDYHPDSGRAVHRRSIYIYWKRTSPHPMMTLFDAPSRENSCVRRSRTSSALQSLGLFNETQRVEAARHVARRLLELPSPEERLHTLFTWLACRKPSDLEMKACQNLLKQQLERYEKEPNAARELLGERTPDYPSIAEAAAWTQVAATLLASDAAILLY